MSIPSLFHSEFLYCDNVINKADDQNDSSSYPILSPHSHPLQGPPTYNIHDASGCNFIHRYSSGTPASHQGFSNFPLVGTFRNSCPPTEGHSWNGLPGAAAADTRNHKMVERQRRKEMNSRFSMLRSLLPNESLRGKRAASDQVQAAVNYVRHLQQKMEDLLTERNKMKENSGENAKVSFDGVRLPCNEKLIYSKAPPIGGSDRKFLTVKLKSMGSAVQVWADTFEHQIVYSDLLLALEEGGLEVVSAASSAINNRVYHTIHSKVSDPNTFNIDTLHQKLSHLIKD